MAFLARRRVVNTLRVFWVLVIIWYEYGTFSSSVRSCAWPDQTMASRKDSNIIQARPARVLLVADPQIIDRNSYPSRSKLSAYLTRLIVDLNLRKNWQVAIKKRPDVVVFLGDMMDNGRNVMSDAEYEQYYARFTDIFRLDPAIPQYYIPGNHDIGLGKAMQFSQNARSRYVEHFGLPNHEVLIANHSLILLDAPGYADEDAQMHGQRKTLQQWTPRRGGALEFVTKFAQENHKDPIVLFSHIPLYRPDGRSCGPLRERGSIRPGVGPGYQNILEKQSSQRLLQFLSPVAVFSGDDHDYCEYVHPAIPPQLPYSIREITVKSLSMVMNVRRPGFQLLSLLPLELRSEDSPTLADTPCLLPDQIRIYLEVYLPLLALSLLVVLVSNLSAPRRTFHPRTDSDEVLFQADIEDSPQTNIGIRSNYKTVPRISLSPQRFTASYQHNNLTSRSPKPTGWFVLQGSRRKREAENVITCDWESIRDTICICTHGILRFRRRTVFTTTLSDVRDVAIFPLACFVFITWWVVTG